jgi:hypothetical protein
MDDGGVQKKMGLLSSLLVVLLSDANIGVDPVVLLLVVVLLLLLFVPY